MSKVLTGKKIAILATDGFEESELFVPLKALKDVGAEVEIVSLKGSSIRAWKDKDWGKSVDVDKLVSEVSASDYNALMLPGGVMNPDKLRREETAVSFVQDFFEAGKPIAAICHAPQLLIETGFLDGRSMTSYESIKTDLLNAGADWIDEEVVSDNGLVTSRTPEDLPAFCKKMIEEFAEGKHFGVQRDSSVNNNSAVL